MSFTERLVLWLHIAFVIFAIGPVTAATMASPRAIRHHNVAVLRHHLRATRIFGAAALGVLIVGVVLGQARHDLGKAWLTASMTLFVVALVLLVLIMRDQRRAVTALAAPAAPAPAQDDASTDDQPDGNEADELAQPAPAGNAAAAHRATVERGRIASMAGVVSLIWLAILVLMVWQP
jgi:hypothetical protein